MGTTTPWGQTVIETAESPRQFEPTFDGRPLDEVVRDERRRAEAGLPSGLPQDGPSGLDVGGGRPLQAFREIASQRAFKEASGGNITPGLASNEAYTASIVAGSPEAYETYKNEYLTQGTIFLPAIDALRQAQQEQAVVQSGRLDPDYLASLGPKERLEVVNDEIARVKMGPLSVNSRALLITLAAGHGDMPQTNFETAWRNIPAREINRYTAKMQAQYRQRARREIDEAAAQLYISTGRGVQEIVKTDILPFTPWYIRDSIASGIAEVSGVDIGGGGFHRLFLGSTRAKIREAFAAMSPAEFNQAAAETRAWIEDAQADPIRRELLTRYGIMEFFDSVFTEGVYDGTSAKNAGDEFWGNVEGLVEGTIGLALLWKGVKGVRRAFAATSGIQARNAAAAANPQVAGDIDRMFQQDGLAIQFDLLPDEAVPTQLPRPSIFVDDIEELPDGAKRTVIRSERVRSEILETTESQGLGLTAADRTAVVNDELAKLDLIDHPHVMGRMSTLQSLGDDAGFKMRVVVGETAEGGYKELEDVMMDLAVIDPQMEVARIMKVNRDGVLEEVFSDPVDFARALTTGEVDPRTAGRILGDGPDESFYIVYDQERFWRTVDKEAFGASAFQSGKLPRFLLSPNAKFGDEIYGSFLRAYMGEQSLLKNFEIMFEPFYRLGPDDKRFVAGTYEWMEQYGKDHGRAPTIHEIVSEFEDVTPKQLDGLIALREGMDTLHELFNRRLYREWQAEGFKTARPVDPSGAQYHGRVLDQSNAGGFAMDPETGQMVRLSRREAEQLYFDGGGVMKLDVPVEVPNTPKARATRILLRPEQYEIGELSTRPLRYHPGYSMRFYDDPYYIVKSTEGVSLDGTLRSSDSSSIVEEAVKTAGTLVEAERFARRANRAELERGTSGVSFKVVRANDLSQTESTLFMKETLQREGRLFWDERSFDRLPDVNGNLAELEDPVRALERGIGQAARQLTHEDLLRSVKNAFKNQFGDLLPKDMLERMDLGEVRKRLRTLEANTPGEKMRISQARELVDYLRLIEGTESMVIPRLREAALGVAVAVNKWTNRTFGKQSKGLEQFAMTMDPFRAMRSVAFNLFMVFRPVRQALLQSTQIGYLAPLDPGYVMSAQLFKDAYALRRGLTSLRKEAYDDGFSVKTWAKNMGITEKEYRKLLKEFDRSGLIDLVDVHSFAGGATRFQKTSLPANESLAGTIGYRGRQFSAGTRDFFQSWGFNFGERNNLTFTYNIALRRVMKDKKKDSLLELSPKDWDEVRTEASNLALGMVRPNNFGYQTGAIGVATQFLSFSHKAMLGLIGQNPAIKGTDAMRLVLGTYLLYGANMYGARDYAEDILTNIGVPDQEVPGLGVSLVDLLSGGIIDTTFNGFGDLASGDWKDIDTSPFAPGLDFPRMWDMQLRNLWDQPQKVVFGPFGNIASDVLTSLDVVHAMKIGDPDLHPADKFVRGAQIIALNTIPQYTDGVRAWMGYQMGVWYSSANEPLPLRATWNGIVARGLFGGRTVEELNYYKFQNVWWEDSEEYNNAVRETRKALKQYTSLFYEGTWDMERYMQTTTGLINMFEDMPEGVRAQFMDEVMEGVVDQNDRLIEKSVFGHIVEKALENKKFHSFDEIENYVKDMEMEPQKKAWLLQALKEAHEQRVMVDAEAQEALSNGGT